MSSADLLAWWEQRFDELEAAGIASAPGARLMLTVAARRLERATSSASAARMLGTLRSALIAAEIEAAREADDAPAVPRTVH